MKLDLVFSPHAHAVRTQVIVDGVPAGELSMPEGSWLLFAAALVQGGRTVPVDVTVTPARPELAPEIVRSVP